jgi:hypothetical protein
MLAPKKHLNLDVSVVRIAAIVLRELQRRGVMEFERLRATVVRRVGFDGDLSFLPALSFSVYDGPHRVSSSQRYG